MNIPHLKLKNMLKGILAGFIATITLSLVMIIKQAIGFIPELNPIHIITQMINTQVPILGWIGHFFIGPILWGILFSFLSPLLPGAHWFRGVIFSTGAWLVMIIIMPMAGTNLYNLTMDMMAPIAALMMHWIFGIVMGATYGALITK